MNKITKKMYLMEHFSVLKVIRKKTVLCTHYIQSGLLLTWMLNTGLDT